MLKPSRWIAVAVLVALLAGCAGGPVRRVSEPAASVQQLTVQEDGNWSIDLRLQNYSSIPMRFDRARFAFKVGDEDAGTLLAEPAITIGGESADVVTVAFTPSSIARIVLADALASGRGIRYSLEGAITATPDDRSRVRDYDFKRNSQLSPVPGLPGVLR
ncbi:MAG: LEA type 2 family protein [Luteimonas sp.]|nr:LEA type 2 family protein [Luteimonas sp.]